MSSVWIDADAAAIVASRWSVHADDLHRHAVQVDQLLCGLAVDDTVTAVADLASAANELWAAVASARSALGAAGAADTPAMTATTVTATSPWSPSSGDHGGTGDREMRGWYEPVGPSGADRAASVLCRALADTGDGARLRPDEFGLVRIDDRRFVVVLPGVTDLSRPDPGWHDRHRSVRDLDRAAFESARSTGTSGNRYARMVHESLVDAGVPTGSELLMIGHSFGADTALDLAADPAFTGSGGYRVTHVLAAGYHSRPQLPHVSPSTSVLVLQNRFDAAVITETIGATHVVDAMSSQARAVASAQRLDLGDAVEHQVRAAGHGVGMLLSAGRHLASRAGDLFASVPDAARGHTRPVVDAAAGLVTPRAGVSTPGPDRVVSVFDGGLSGFGHHQDHYVDHLERSDDPAVRDFLQSVADSGYAEPGVMVAVDVSVPE